jgi:hypothetical protein
MNFQEVFSSSMYYGLEGYDTNQVLCVYGIVADLLQIGSAINRSPLAVENFLVREFPSNRAGAERLSGTRRDQACGAYKIFESDVYPKLSEGSKRLAEAIYKVNSTEDPGTEGLILWPHSEYSELRGEIVRLWP